jgi:hypothetical protein
LSLRVSISIGPTCEIFTIGFCTKAAKGSAALAEDCARGSTLVAIVAVVAVAVALALATAPVEAEDDAVFVVASGSPFAAEVSDLFFPHAISDAHDDAAAILALHRARIARGYQPISSRNFFA